MSPNNVHATGCLARWTPGSPIKAIEAEQVERTQRKTWSWARSEVCAHTGFYRTYFQRPSVLDPTQG
jgi:hypothetical protein